MTFPKYREVSSGEAYRIVFEDRGWRKPRKNDPTFLRQVRSVDVELVFQYDQPNHRTGAFGARPILRISKKEWSRVSRSISPDQKHGTVAAFFPGPREYYEFFGNDFSPGQAPVKMLSSCGAPNEKRLQGVIDRVEDFASSYDELSYWRSYKRLFLGRQMAITAAGVFGSLMVNNREADARAYYEELGEFVESADRMIDEGQWDFLNLTLDHFGIPALWSK